MKCTQIEAELMAYHFGVIAPEVRDDLEAHLLDCPSCLRQFIALKREVETAELDERPSKRARQRLRSAVAQAVGAEPVIRPWSWWERPLALGFAGAAVVVGMIAVQAVATGEGRAPYALTSPQGAEAPAP